VAESVVQERDVPAIRADRGVDRESVQVGQEVPPGFVQDLAGREENGSQESPPWAIGIAQRTRHSSNAQKTFFSIS